MMYFYNSSVLLSFVVFFLDNRLFSEVIIEYCHIFSHPDGVPLFVSAKSNRVCEHVIDQIRQAIFDGRLRPGDKLPTEKELIEEFHVSRGTLREALRSLEGLGVLHIRQGVAGGPYVTEIGVERAKENLASFFQFKNLSIQNLVEVRLMLEPDIAAKVAATITDEDLGQLKNLIKKCKRILRQRGTSELREEFLEFHRIIASVTDNPILTFLLDVIKNLPVNGLDAGRRPTKKFARYVLEDHIRIYEALEQRNPERARAEVTSHILGLEPRFEDGPVNGTQQILESR
jgi:GntR family transcriptional regulator, transcriptional repressor for pyruvate dehydrogenase complex